MDRPAFDHAWLQANGLAELAFLRSLARAFAAVRQPPTEAQREAVAEFAQRVSEVNEDNFDWSALAGVEGFGVPADDGAAPLFEEPPEAASRIDLTDVPQFAEAVAFEDDPEDGEPDVARYLEHVARARPALERRIAHAHESADAAALAALAAAAPGLAQPLDAADFVRWLERYEQDEPEVVALVAELRRFEPGL